jgi:hypothetical protein
VVEGVPLLLKNRNIAPGFRIELLSQNDEALRLCVKAGNFLQTR